jgi:hypothetical protein
LCGFFLNGKNPGAIWGFVVFLVFLGGLEESGLSMMVFGGQ